LGEEPIFVYFFPIPNDKDDEPFSPPGAECCTWGGAHDPIIGFLTFRTAIAHKRCPAAGAKILYAVTLMSNS
jgi:hypothetical protein